MQPASSDPTASYAVNWFAPQVDRPDAARRQHDKAHAASRRLFAEVVVSKVLFTVGIAVAASVIVLWLASTIA